jgi:hypothetical protein
MSVMVPQVMAGPGLAGTRLRPTPAIDSLYSYSRRADWFIGALRLVRLYSKTGHLSKCNWAQRVSPSCSTFHSCEAAEASSW